MTLLVAASMAAALVGPVGPTCDDGLCAEFRPSSTGMAAHGSFDPQVDAYAELTVSVYAFTKGSSQRVLLARATAAGEGPLDATTEEAGPGRYLAVFACAEISPVFAGDPQRQVCDY